VLVDGHDFGRVGEMLRAVPRLLTVMGTDNCKAHCANVAV